MDRWTFGSPSATVVTDVTPSVAGSYVNRVTVSLSVPVVVVTRSPYR